MATRATVERMRRTAAVSSSGALVQRGAVSSYSTGPSVLPGFTGGGGYGYPLPGGGSSGFDVGGAFTGAAGAGGCDLLPAGWARDLCKLGAGVISGGAGGAGGSGATGGGAPGTPIVNEPQCQAGTIRVGNRCVSPGDAFPGGDPFVMPAGGVAVTGAFGLPAFQPEVVGSINGNAVRRCPRRTVLGMDNLCYAKGTIGRNYRKWPPAAKPPVTAFDARMMRKYGPGGSKQNRVKDLAMKAGFSCKKK